MSPTTNFAVTEKDTNVLQTRLRSREKLPMRLPIQQPLRQPAVGDRQACYCCKSSVLLRSTLSCAFVGGFSCTCTATFLDDLSRRHPQKSSKPSLRRDPDFPEALTRHQDISCTDTLISALYSHSCMCVFLKRLAIINLYENI
jgi:hypothetical protein